MLHGRRQVGELAEPLLPFDGRVADHQRVEPDANLRQVMPAADPHRVDPREACAPRAAGSVVEVERDAQLAGEDVGRAHGQDAQRRAGAGQGVGDGRDGAVPARGDHQLDAAGQPLADHGTEVVALAELVELEPGLPLGEAGRQGATDRVSGGRPRSGVHDRDDLPGANVDGVRLALRLQVGTVIGGLSIAGGRGDPGERSITRAGPSTLTSRRDEFAAACLSPLARAALFPRRGMAGLAPIPLESTSSRRRRAD